MAMSYNLRTSHKSPKKIFINPIFAITIFFILPAASAIEFKISRFDASATNILYEGDAVPFNGAIELTRVDYLCRVGWATFSQPVHLWDKATQKLTDFTAHFSFSIDTRNSSTYGSYQERHIIHSWEFSSTMGAETGDGKIDRKVRWLVAMIICAGTLMGGACTGWFFLSRRRIRARKAYEEMITVTSINVTQLPFQKALPLRIIIINIILFFLLPHAHSVYFNFSQFKPNDPSQIKYMLDAYPSDGFIELTKNQLAENIHGSTGRAIYSDRVRIWDSKTRNLTDFNTQFSFIINGLNESKPGDGFAFFLSANGSKIPSYASLGESLGIYSRSNSSKNQLVAIEFDTFNNTWDPSLPHVGININSKVSEITSYLRISSKDKVCKGNALVSYSASTKNLSVFLSYDENPSFGEDPDLRYTVDLREILPEWADCGFSATTGLAIELHQIHSWEFSSTLEISEAKANSTSLTGNNSEEPKKEAKKTGLIAGLVVGGAVLSSGLGALRLAKEFDEEQMGRLMILGLWCAHPDHNLRPSIRQVISVLTLEASLPSLPSKMPVPMYVAPPMISPPMNQSSFSFAPSAYATNSYRDESQGSHSSQTTSSNGTLLGDHEHGLQTMVIARTVDYLTPECITTCKASDESDAYVVLFIYYSPAHSISFNFSSFDPSGNGILYEGDAWNFNDSIQLNRVDDIVRVGRATSVKHIHLKDTATQSLSDFTTHFSFTVDVMNSSVYSDGLTFFLSPPYFHLPPNSAGGYLGLCNSTTYNLSSRNHFVAVEFDTYVNEWDPNVQHIGIIVNSLAPVAHVSWNASLHSGQVANAWIHYNATARLLSIVVTYENNPSSSSNYNLSYQVDLMQVLPDWVMVGFTGSTSSFVEKHMVHSWEFSSTLTIKEAGKTIAIPETKKARKFIWEVIMVIVVAVLLGGVGIGSVMVVKRKRRRAMEEKVTLTSMNNASKESDVYSFGVVALEIACGRKPLESSEDESMMRLVEWVWKLHENGRLLDAADNGLRTDYDKKQMECLMMVGLWCAQPDPSSRPSIRQVMRVLNMEEAMPVLPNRMPGPMTIYNIPPETVYSNPPSITNLISNEMEESSNENSSNSSKARIMLRFHRNEEFINLYSPRNQEDQKEV
ncbi:Concanavalin A-like protein lectin/glucanase superfamily [Cinnamomum micranthum f. kanehirae]|uniref:Concanavalin A-like protein lectin/glucanase superfamily n=1 Tax=Cinnamomum micranthum f. kanehirae TaxID=337451 RepID=A0A443NFN8_9MAGN|nr:Concanavalin A-like protein lectin/glucanase superfamily [Cinnamomum micranthum f. kanehirae]